MSCERHYFTSLGIERWAFEWSPLPGSNELHCLAALLHMFGVKQPRGLA